MVFRVDPGARLLVDAVRRRGRVREPARGRRPCRRAAKGAWRSVGFWIGVAIASVALGQVGYFFTQPVHRAVRGAEDLAVGLPCTDRRAHLPGP